MQSRDVIHLNLTGCKTLLDLHERIRTTFDFPDWYGHNWNAFYDLMRTDVSANKVIITGEHTVASVLQPQLKIMHNALDQLVRYNLHELNEVFTYEIVS